MWVSASVRSVCMLREIERVCECVRVCVCDRESPGGLLVCPKFKYFATG